MVRARIRCGSPHEGPRGRSSVRSKPMEVPLTPPEWLADLARVDAAVYAAVAATPTPTLDHVMRRVSAAADNSRLSLIAAGVLAATRGEEGRRAAALGIGSVAITSVTVNLMIKPVARRRRPDRDLHGVPLTRHVAMPKTRSLP